MNATLDANQFAWFRRNPEEWAIRALGIDAWRDYPDACKGQLSLFRSIFTNRRTACKSGHKTGKTFVLAVATLAWLILYPDSKVITTAPTGRQVRELLWQEIQRLHGAARELGRPLGGAPLQTKYTLGPGWFAIGFATDEAGEGVQAQGWSGEHILWIFDEAGGIPRQVWEVADTALQEPTAHIVVAGNPHDPATPFYDACTSELWELLTLSSRNAPNIRAGKTIIPGTASADWCDEKLAEHGENGPQYLFRVLGQFPDVSMFSKISLADCEAAQKRTVKPGAKAGGCDVARFGDDKTVIIGMDGGQVTSVEKLSGCDTVDVAGVCARLYREQGWEAIAVDDTGVGGGVTDILMQDERIMVIPVNFGEAAYDPEKCADRVTEMYMLLAEDLHDGEIGGLPRDGIVRELTGRRYRFTLKQQQRLEKKEEFKKRIGHSPDTADALLLANYARRMSGVDAAAMISGIFV